MQGGVCELPIADFPTGVMRGRFHTDGALYACGMVGWASSCRQEGGFYRLRYTGKAASLPLAVHAAKDKLTVTFSDPLDPRQGEARRLRFQSLVAQTQRELRLESRR